jgi:beta-glucanase (GH16 family)
MRGLARNKAQAPEHYHGPGHKQAGTRVEIPGINMGYHTFGLLWTPGEYVFFVDGVETWRTTEAVSQIPEYMILSVELSGWGGDVTQATLPDEILFDYVRVYEAASDSQVGGLGGSVSKKR